MSNSPELHLLLEHIATQLAAVESKLGSAQALNGGFDKLCEKVDDLQKDFVAVKTTLLGDGANQVGVVTRLRELEASNTERQRFMSSVVEPALGQHQRLIFQMESVQDIVKDEEKQKQEMILLKERVAILNKVMWLFGTGLGGVLCKSLYDMMSGS